MAETVQSVANSPMSQHSSWFSRFGPPPILPGEDAEAYDELLMRASGGIKPTDAIEELWLRDYVALAWEIVRLRRFKESLIASALPDALRTVLKIHKVSDRRANILVKKWRAQGPTAKDEIRKTLASLNLTFDDVLAQAFLIQIEQIERIDRLITIAEARRNDVLREIDRHRASSAQKMRDEIQRLSKMIELEAIESVPIAPHDGGKVRP